MNKRIISLSLALVLVLGLFAGCGSTNNEPAPTDAVATPTEPVVAAPVYEDADPADAAGAETVQTGV